MNRNNDKHKEAQEILKELVNSQKKTDVVLAELKLIVEYHDKELNK